MVESSGDIGAEMQELAKVVYSEAFMQMQKKFLEEHSKKADANEEDVKSAQEAYKKLIEEELAKQIGAETLQKIQGGLKSYSKIERQDD